MARWLLSAFAAGACVLVVWQMKQALTASIWNRLGLALLLGGAGGNLIDRIQDGVVTDFVELYYATWSWPIFNLADACITLGVGVWLFGCWKTQPQVSVKEEITTVVNQ